MKKKIFIFCFVILIFLTPMSISAEVITYDFDEIEVIYAAEFMVNITGCEENWFTDLAGKDNSVSVLYGIVSLSNSTDIIREEFIKVTGAEGTERFLLTSDHYDYYEDGVTLKAAKSFFWSAKRIVGTDIVKDFTLPIISLTLYRDFNLDSSLRAISVYPSNDGMTATEEFWRGTIPEGTIPVDLSTLYYYGDPSYISL